MKFGWYGLVWIGMDWFGLVWIGMDWYGTMHKIDFRDSTIVRGRIEPRCCVEISGE